MKPLDITREWLDKAEEDYQFACKNLETSTFYAQICFHYQQAAEKYLKAIIIAKKLPFRPVHNLIELWKTGITALEELRQLEDACYYLNPFYIDTRYPVHWPVKYDSATALEAKEHVTTIRDLTLQLLKEQTS
ncbi:HEPN domain-containing protein [bacterium]|nr:HEPN domain-containing protein [bacterium]MBU1882528.1 HEPN domain-containing protein [bacterium]